MPFGIINIWKSADSKKKMKDARLERYKVTFPRYTDKYFHRQNNFMVPAVKFFMKPCTLQVFRDKDRSYEAW